MIIIILILHADVDNDDGDKETRQDINYFFGE